MSHFFKVSIKTKDNKKFNASRTVHDLERVEGKNAIESAKEHWKKYFPNEEVEKCELLLGDAWEDESKAATVTPAK